MAKWTWQGREVHSPWIKALMAVWIFVWFTLVACWFVVFIALAIVLLPVWLPIDWLLKRNGKRGFAYHDHVENSLNLKFNIGAFRDPA